MDKYTYEEKINIFKNDMDKVNKKLNYYINHELLNDPNQDNYILKNNLNILLLISEDIEQKFINVRDLIVNKKDDNIIKNEVEDISESIQLILHLVNKYNINSENFENKIIKLSNNNIEHFGWKSIMKAAKKFANKIVNKVLKPVEKFFKNIFKQITGIFNNIINMLDKIKDLAVKYILKILNWLLLLGKMFLYLIETLIPGISKFIYNFSINFYNKASQTWMIVPVVYTLLRKFIPIYLDYVIIDIIRAFGIKKYIYNSELNMDVPVDFFFEDDSIKTISLALSIFLTWILFWKNTQTLITIKDYIISFVLYLLLKFIDLIKYILLNVYKFSINHEFFTELGNLKDPKFLYKKFLQLLDLIINNIEEFIMISLFYLILIVYFVKNVLPQFKNAIPTLKEMYLYINILIHNLINLKSK